MSETKTFETKVIAGWFYEHLAFTRLMSSDAVALAIARGVADAKFGYTAVWQVDDGNLVFPNRELVYFGRSLRLDEIDLGDSAVLNAELAREATYVAPAPENVIKPPPEERSGNPPVIPAPSGSRQASKKRYRLTASADKSKIFQAIRVLQNLVDKADQVSMQIEVLAEANDEFDPVWIRNAVEEPLDEADVDACTQFE